MKIISLLGLTTLAALTMLSAPASAEQSRYTCQAGALTIISTSPCYVNGYGISVPGKDGVAKGNEGKQAGGAGGNKFGGFDGPKDIADKPNGGGFNGPKDFKDKD